jgi:ABC-type sulfate transport system substrate-binding protein
MQDAMDKTGRVKPSEEQLKTRLEKACFVDVQTFTLKQPVGPWAKAKYGFLDCRGAVLPTEKRGLLRGKTLLIHTP